MISWELKLSISGDDVHSLIYRGKYKQFRGVQMEIHTMVKDNGEFGTAEIYFFADNDSGIYRTEDELLKALEGSGD